MPFFVLCLFFVLCTYFAHITEQSDWQRLFKINWHRVLALLDLREENTVATWFSSTLFFMAGWGFILLGWGNAALYTLKTYQRRLFQLAALGCIALSADEVGSVHETIGSWLDRSTGMLNDTPLYGKGYPWLIAAPIIIGIVGFVVQQLWTLNRAIHVDAKLQNKIRLVLITTMIFLPCVFIFEFLEAYFWMSRQTNTIFPVLEEMSELLGMLSLYTACLWLGKIYQL